MCLENRDDGGDDNDNDDGVDDGDGGHGDDADDGGDNYGVDDGGGDGDDDQNSMKTKGTDHPQMTVLSLQVGKEEIFKSLSLN